MIADIQNEEDFSNSDSDDDYAEEEVTTNTDDCTRAHDDDRQTTLGRDGSQWRRSAPSQVSAVRLPQQNIVKIRAGLTAFSASRILCDNPI